MLTFLYHAHSGLRYLVLLAGLAAAVLLAMGLFSRRPFGNPARAAHAAFNGLMDLQLLLGIVMVAMGRFYPSLIGHMVMMVLAVAASHATSVLARKAPDARRAYSLGLMGVVVALALIVGGIMAIRSSPFESRAFAEAVAE